ncbi:hypothetical protein OPQ81_000886 [Rhizoctonia solani]|nr:hypothetical protein OPQ81_000886 [Rhizoctonia solani]
MCAAKIPEYLVDLFLRAQLGKSGPLTKGVLWHIGSFGVGGYSEDYVHIEETDLDAGQLLKNDIAGIIVLKPMEDCGWSPEEYLLRDGQFRIPPSPAPYRYTLPPILILV